MNAERQEVIMKKITAVRITNATDTGATLITIVYHDENGNKSVHNTPAIITNNDITGEREYYADTKEIDKEMKDFIKTATKTVKNKDDKFAYIYK